MSDNAQHVLTTYIKKQQWAADALLASGLALTGNAFCELLFVGGATQAEKTTDALVKAARALNVTPGSWAFLNCNRESTGSSELHATLASLQPLACVLYAPEALNTWKKTFNTGDVETAHVFYTRGIPSMYIGNFEAALGDERAKRDAWRALQEIAHARLGA